jgi:hypothetical protein
MRDLNAGKCGVASSIWWISACYPVNQKVFAITEGKENQKKMLPVQFSDTSAKTMISNESLRRLHPAIKSRFHFWAEIGSINQSRQTVLLALEVTSYIGDLSESDCWEVYCPENEGPLAARNSSALPDLKITSRWIQDDRLLGDCEYDKSRTFPHEIE